MDYLWHSGRSQVKSCRTAELIWLASSCLSERQTIQRLADTSLADENLQITTRRYFHRTYGDRQSILVTINGKTLRGTISKGKTRGVHLLAAYLSE